MIEILRLGLFHFFLFRYPELRFWFNILILPKCDFYHIKIWEVYQQNLSWDKDVVSNVQPHGIQERLWDKEILIKLKRGLTWGNQKVNHIYWASASSQVLSSSRLVSHILSETLLNQLTEPIWNRMEDFHTRRTTERKLQGKGWKMILPRTRQQSIVTFSPNR